MRLIPAVLAAVVLYAAPVAADTIPDTPEPWLYAVGMPPVEVAVVEVVEQVAVPEAVAQEPGPLAEPVLSLPLEPPVIAFDAAGKQAALTLPASEIAVTVYGEDVRVVAWFDEDRHQTFVFERSDGTRAVVVGLARFGPVYPVTEDPCVEDVFGLSVGYPTTCPAQPLPD